MRNKQNIKHNSTGKFQQVKEDIGKGCLILKCSLKFKFLHTKWHILLIDGMNSIQIVHFQVSLILQCGDWWHLFLKFFKIFIFKFFHLHLECFFKIKKNIFFFNFLTCISNVVSSLSSSVFGFGTKPDIASLENILFSTFLSLFHLLHLSHLLVEFLTLPAGSKNKVAGLLNVDKQVCRALAFRHLVMMVNGKSG